MSSKDPLEFEDRKKYTDRLKEIQEKTRGEVWSPDEEGGYPS